jgi:ATP-binding protein involved in chromosome partitioning
MFGQAQLNVPIIGLVENMSYFTPAELPDNKYFIFGKEGGRRLASEYDLPFLGEIPLVQGIREGGDKGKPIMVSEDAVSRRAFEEFAAHVVRSISMRNAQLSAEKIAELVS